MSEANVCVLPGTSNKVNVPCGKRTKPWVAWLGSTEIPAIAAEALMLLAKVNRAPGASNKVMAP